MGSSYGENIRMTIFGQSHSAAIGMTLEGVPAGVSIDMEELGRFMARRAPGGNKYVTARKEADIPEFISGLVGNVTCGTPITAIIRNTDTKPGDYEQLRHIPRPGHADFTAAVKYGGYQDYSGGGHFSGRLTAPLCIAGGICMQILAQKGIMISAKIASIGTEHEDEAKMFEQIDRARERGDSVGGTISCEITGVPAGLGDPMFDGMENRIARAVFGIPAVKGIEFGLGFAAAELFGSENNDEFCVIGEGGVNTQGAGHSGLCVDTTNMSGTGQGSPSSTAFSRVMTRTNNCGGILGGITDGMPLTFRVAIKPTPSISLPQRSVDLDTMQETELVITGRHDPCIVPRAVPCVEAAAALAVYDALIR